MNRYISLFIILSTLLTACGTMGGSASLGETDNAGSYETYGNILQSGGYALDIPIGWLYHLPPVDQAEVLSFSSGDGKRSGRVVYERFRDGWTVDDYISTLPYRLEGNQFIIEEGEIGLNDGREYRFIRMESPDNKREILCALIPYREEILSTWVSLPSEQSTEAEALLKEVLKRLKTDTGKEERRVIPEKLAFLGLPDSPWYWNGDVYGGIRLSLINTEIKAEVLLSEKSLESPVNSDNIKSAKSCKVPMGNRIQELSCVLMDNQEQNIYTLEFTVKGFNCRILFITEGLEEGGRKAFLESRELEHLLNEVLFFEGGTVE